jgi:colicin import membrane protein
VKHIAKINGSETMARKLKTYITDVGFYQLAVAAPSMKAALEAWEMKYNVFQEGLAKETHDAAIVAAAEAAPGKVLKRPIGTKGAFKKNPTLPKVKTSPKQEMAQAKRKTNEAAVLRAEAALRLAEAGHQKATRALAQEREALDERANKEDERWRLKKEKLERAIEDAKRS